MHRCDAFSLLLGFRSRSIGRTYFYEVAMFLVKYGVKMETVELSQVVRSLREEEKRLEESLSALSKEKGRVEEGLSRVKDALTALLGKGRKKKAGRGASKDEVLPALLTALTAKETLSLEELKERVVDALTKEGRPTKGVHFALKSALSDPRFVEAQGGWRLTTKEALAEKPEPR